MDATWLGLTLLAKAGRVSLFRVSGYGGSLETFRGANDIYQNSLPFIQRFESVSLDS